MYFFTYKSLIRLTIVANPQYVEVKFVSMYFIRFAICIFYKLNVYHSSLTLLSNEKKNLFNQAQCQDQRNTEKVAEEAKQTQRDAYKYLAQHNFNSSQFWAIMQTKY